LKGIQTSLGLFCGYCPQLYSLIFIVAQKQQQHLSANSRHFCGKKPNGVECLQIKQNLTIVVGRLSCLTRVQFYSSWFLAFLVTMLLALQIY